MKKTMLAMTVLVLALGAASLSAADKAERGVAKMKGTAEGSPIAGTVTFEDTKDGLRVVAELTGVPAGEHGFHIHEFGGCDDTGKAAGGHYNPLASPHGQALKNGIHKAHAGDLGNITAGPDGKASLDVVLKKVHLTGGKYDVAGRAVILHEKADDFSQPLGNAGSRIGCGVIVVAGR